MTQSTAKFSGPGYITKVVHSLEGGVKKIATSRRHRKGRGALLVTSEGVHAVSPRFKYPWLHIWVPARLTWWVAVLFIIGSVLFSVGGYAITFPEETPKVLTTGLTVDWIFLSVHFFLPQRPFVSCWSL